MEFWDGRERHASPYGKYRTVPGWSSSSHIYPSKIPAAPGPESRPEYQGWMSEPSSWMIPGSRTGGTMRDYVNWTEIASSSRCPPENLHCPQELATMYSGQERGLERQRVLVDQHREKERLVQRGELANKWQTCNSTLHRKEKEKLSANSFRELEAWANRYYHSLPRQRHLEAGMWNATQNLPECKRMPRPSNRLVSPEPNQIPLANTPAPHNQEKCNLNNRLRAQLEAWKAQQLPSYVPAKQSPLRRDTVPSTSFSHPPNYMSPPPYSGPQDTNILQLPGQCTAKASAEPVMEYRVESRPVTSAFPVPRTSEHSFVPLTEERQHTVHPSSDRILRTLDLTYHDTDQVRKQQMLLSTLAESLPVKQQAVQKQETAMPQQSSHQIAEKNQMPYLDDPLPQQSKPKRRRGGETVFCLVSRMGELAGLSSSPDEPLKSHSLPLLNIPTSGGLEAKQNCEIQKESQVPVKLADEVDSDSLMSDKVESVISERFKGKSLDKTADQILTNQEAANKERLRREIQETLLAKHTVKQSFQIIKESKDPKTCIPYKVEESIVPCVSSQTPLSPQTTESLVVAHSDQNTVKFPVWKEPKWHYCSKGVSQKKEEPDHNISNLGPKEEATDTQPKQSEVRNNINTIKDKSRGLVVIDATCVVVKVEFIFPPEKEHVQYVCSRSSDSYEHSSESMNLQVQNDDLRNTDTIGVTEKSSVANKLQELHVQIREKDDDDLRNRSPIHVVSDIVLKDPGQIPNEAISENETLKERAERILGITFQNSSNEGHTLNELPQMCETEEDLQRIQEEPGGSSVAEIDDVRNTESQLMGVESSYNLESPTKEIAKGTSMLMMSTEKMLEESEVNLDYGVKTLQTHEVIAVEITRQENEDTSKDAEVIFATQHTEAESRSSSDTGTTQHLNNSLEGKVNERPSNGTSGTNYLLSSILDDCAKRTTQSFLQEGSPREGNPLFETGDVNSTCSTLQDDLVEDNCEIHAQEETPSEGIFSNDLQNLCLTLIQDLPVEGNSSFEMDDSCEERNDESLGKEGNSRDSETSNATDDVSSLCQIETYMETACECIGQKDASNLSDKNNDIKNICSLLGNSVEGTIETQLNQEGTLFDEPSILDNSLESPSGKFIQKAPSYKEDSLLNSSGEKDPGECHPLGKMDGIGNLHPGFLNDHVEDSCQRFGQEHSTEDANKSSKTGDICNVCLFHVSSSVKDLNDQESEPKEGSQSIKQDNACDLGDVVHLDSSKPFSKEGGPMEGSLSDEADSTRNPCSVCYKKSEENKSQFVKEQEDSYQTFGTSDKTNTVQNLSQTLHGSSEKDLLELFCQESRPSKGSLLNETGDVNSPCCPALGCNVGNSSEFPDHEDIKDNGDISLPALTALYCSTLHEQESTSQSSPEPLSPCLSESPQQLNKCCLLAPSLLETSCSSSHSEHQPKLLSLFSSETDINPSTLPTSDLSDHSQFLESWSQAGNVHCEVWSPTSSTSTKCKKKQYPKSLWDAVNRIRKHTAPDSETEDEENGVELWEQMANTVVEDHLTDDTEVQLQESALEEGRMGGIIERNEDKEHSSDVSIISDMYLVGGTIGKGIPIKEGEHLDEVERTVYVGQPEDDTLSSSSLDSHDSNDTVIEGEGNEPILRSNKEEDRKNEELHQTSHLSNENKGISSGELNSSGVLEEDDNCHITGGFKDNQ